MTIVMVNPVIISKSDPYATEEGCMSLSGVRLVTRYNKIKVLFQDESFRSHSDSIMDRLPRSSIMSVIV